MLEVKWEYLEDNIGSDRPVAILKSASASNIAILHVYEARDHHYCILSPEYNFLNPITVNYYMESQNVNIPKAKAPLESGSTHNVLLLYLKEGCKIIEEDIIKQIRRIYSLIS